MKIENENHLNFVFCGRSTKRTHVYGSKLVCNDDLIEKKPHSDVTDTSKRMHKNADTDSANAQSHICIWFCCRFLLCVLRLCLSFLSNFSVCMHGKCTSLVLVLVEPANANIRRWKNRAWMLKSDGASVRHPEQYTITIDHLVRLVFKFIHRNKTKNFGPFLQCTHWTDVMPFHLLLLFAIQISHLYGPGVQTACKQSMRFQRVW